MPYGSTINDFKTSCMVEETKEALGVTDDDTVDIDALKINIEPSPLDKIEIERIVSSETTPVEMLRKIVLPHHMLTAYFATSTAIDGRFCFMSAFLAREVLTFFIVKTDRDFALWVLLL